MKSKSTIIILLLAIAVVLLAVKIAFFSSPAGSYEYSGKEAKEAQAPKKKHSKHEGKDKIMDNIMTRTSIRAYQDQPVEEEKIEQLLKAAMAAPSAGNKQPWRLVVIQDKSTLEAISENLNTMKMAKEAALAIVVCGDLDDTFPDDGVEYWVQDASAATENLLLAAHDLGLGAVWCGIYPIKERVQYLSGLLRLPANIVPLNVVPVGYPAENPAPKEKWKPEKVRYEKWQ